LELAVLALAQFALSVLLPALWAAAKAVGLRCLFLCRLLCGKTVCPSKVNLIALK